jgi:PleD family two-component response regulator
MVRLSNEKVLLIGDDDRQIYSALTAALPTAHVRSVPTLFDAIAELSHDQFTTVIAAAEPLERRPEEAVKTLRQLSGDSRLYLYGHPTLEPLSQKMLEFGCDDYLITPVTAGELIEVLTAPTLRLRRPPRPADAADLPVLSKTVSPLDEIPVAEILLDALVKFPQESAEAAVKGIDAAMPAGMNLIASAADAAPSLAPEGKIAISLVAPPAAAQSGMFSRSLHLIVPPDFDRALASAFLSDLSRHLANVQALQERHNSLQRMAITDDLTGLANGRYFRHFLAKILEKARVMRFPVTLFLFDIDSFKKYNDQYGHGVGDDILKQTAALMKRCTRDHDLVARISGDEFAVVFWEKEGPRQPRDPHLPVGRTPKETQEMLDRFRRLLATQNFPGLGPGGKGCLTISGGIAVYPYDATDADHLIEAADHQLMFGAKRSGRNSIRLVGGECLPLGAEPPGGDQP